MRLRLAGGADAPARARQALQVLNGGLEGLRDPVKLLVTELVSNSVIHANASEQAVIELEVRSTPSGARVEVEDQGPGFEPRPREPDLVNGGGFGLMLVDRFADRWGVEPSNPSRVWFEIDRA
jgi:anti-sigma regulatory factor (Ser/Thr protein kinase)